MAVFGSPERTERARPSAPPAGASPARAPAYALALVAIVALDPQLFAYVAEGRNDFVVLLPLFAGIALLQRRHHALGLLALAVAAGLKLHASLLLPFAVAYVWWSAPRGPVRDRIGRVARASLPAAAVLAATFLPFLVHFGAFWEDVVAYNAGGTAWSYPIAGLGFSAVLLASGVVSYPQEAFPFWAFELLAAVPQRGSRHAGARLEGRLQLG